MHELSLGAGEPKGEKRATCAVAFSCISHMPMYDRARFAQFVTSLALVLMR